MVAVDLRIGPGLLPVVWGISSCLDFAAGHVALDTHLHPSRALELDTTNDEDSVSFVGFSMFTNGTLSSLNLTSACESALYQTVDCADETTSLMTDTYVGSFDNSTVTALVCDSGCEGSIAQLHDNVAASCGESAELIPGLPFLGLVDMLWSNWNQSCFVDPTTGENCNDVIAAYPNVTDLSDLPTSDLCSYCNVEKLALMQADAYTDVYDENWQTMYETVAETCNIVVANFNATDSVFDVTVPVTTTECVSGNTYTTELGDTCDSIALANSVSAATMFYMNPNIVNCSAIAEDTSLCLPLACNSVYTVQANDTCSTIAADSGLLTKNVLSYNTQLNWNCTNLHSTNPYWGSTLCVSTPGGTYTGQALNTTTSSDTLSVAVDPPTGATVADGTTLDCGEWYTDDDSLTCVQLCLSYEIAINLFTEINPSLSKATCDADLVVGNAYCVDPLLGWDWGNSSTANSTTSSAIVTATTATSATATITGTALTSSAPTTTPSGTTKTCYSWYIAASGDYCGLIEEEFGITFNAFQEWNPNINDDCSNLITGDAYCIQGDSAAQTTQASTSSAPTSTVSGTTSTCYSWHIVTSGDYCSLLEQEYGISFDLLRVWNPSINNDCSNLIVGDAYCIDGSGKLSSLATSSAPASTISGTVSPCYEWHVITDGDYCELLEDEYGLTFDLLRAWNPSINNDCSNLAVGDAYCINGAGRASSLTTISAPAPTITGTTSTCYDWYTVVSGDTCDVIEETYGLYFDLFRAWNPSINNDCTNLQVGDAYCVDGTGTFTTKISSTSSPVSVSASTTTASVTTSTTSGIATPTPHSPNMTSGCAKFYDVVSGDNCYNIAQTYGITLDYFYIWNPDLDNSCDALQVGYYYCVGQY